MKSKVKWFLLASLTALLVASLPACTQTDRPTVTDQQVISIIQVYGVPTIKISGEPVSPWGQWAAVYEGEGKWRIRGAVVATIDNANYYRHTTWLYDPPSLKLVSLEGLTKAPSPDEEISRREERLKYYESLVPK